MSEMNKDSKCRCVGRFAHWLSSIAKVCICAINNFYTLYIENLLVLLAQTAHRTVLWCTLIVQCTMHIDCASSNEMCWHLKAGEGCLLLLTEAFFSLVVETVWDVMY